MHIKCYHKTDQTTTMTTLKPFIPQEDDTYFNRARITSVLAYGETVWVGTGEGNLVVYSVVESVQLATPTDMSPSAETTSTMSYVARPSKHRGMTSFQSFLCLLFIIIVNNVYGHRHS